MNILFRADASIELGTGHVMRCLTLAEALREQGVQCQFVCGLQTGNFLQAILDKGFKATGIKASAQWEEDASQTIAAAGDTFFDWIVVDHYGLDAKWEQALRPKCKKLMVIDDLADRQHDCDLLLDQNLGRLRTDYQKLVPTACELLIGPQYALLRPEFAAWRDYSLKRRTDNPELKHLLISMGGADYPNSTSQILQALKQVPMSTDCHITVVLGATSPWIQQVTALAETMPWTTDVKVNVNNMAELMANSDLAIGAAGSTSWERCCLGLPSLIVILANNQKSGAEHLTESNAAILLQHGPNLNLDLISKIKAISNTPTLLAMSQATRFITYGQGVTNTALKLFDSKICEMQKSDLETVLAWRNHPKIRKHMHSQHEISLIEHENWFIRTISDLKKYTLIFKCNDIPLGYINFTRGSDFEVATWGFYVAPDAPKGTGKRMGFAALQYAFEKLNIKTIRGQVLSTNLISKNFHKALGFNQEQEENQHILHFTLTAQNYD